MADLITTDQLLTELQARTLDAVLDIIIPADEVRGMPSARDVDVMAYVSEVAEQRVDAIREELDSLNEESLKETNAAFADLSIADQQALTEKLKAAERYFLVTTVLQTLNCYYQHDTVLTALGMKPGAPFPEGNEVPHGDLSLLDPVRARGKIYRE